MKNDKTGKRTIRSYFQQEKKLLLLTTITGLIYNIGMTAGPLLEGQLAQELYEILKGSRAPFDIVTLSLIYAAVIAGVQTARALKRLYVRKFANHVSRSMKKSIYHHLVHEPTETIQKEDAGAVMTRAIADADDCAEGMRKFTTEIFDTGVVMIAYLVMLLMLDWRLTLIAIVFPPIAYAASAMLKKKVAQSASDSRKAMSHLNDAAVDQISNALTYRIYGEESNRSKAYEQVLSTYESKNITAGIYQNSPQPVYLVISMIGVIPILYFGGRNVLGSGWKIWSIASFTSFLSCFTKLATKSSHAAKLFNALQKARVSWQRIADWLDDRQEESNAPACADAAVLEMQHVSFAYEDGGFALHDLNLTAKPGEIIGITGKVASGKSTFGKLFLNEMPCEGEITYGGIPIQNRSDLIFAYAGHHPELFTGTIRENITLQEKGAADEARLSEVMREVQIDQEVSPDDSAGNEGSALSGGQQARIALARALYSKAPVLILDDPFAAVDAATERLIFEAMRKTQSQRIILILSHRMTMFPEMDQVGLLEQGTLVLGRHDELMKDAAYRQLYELQSGKKAVYEAQ